MIKNPLKAIKIILNTVGITLLSGVMMLFIIKKDVYVEGAGTVLSGKNINIYAPINGEVKKVYKKFGDKLEKGEIIAEIDKKETENILQENKLMLNEIELKLKSKNVDVESLKRERRDKEKQYQIMEIDLNVMKEEYKKMEFMVKSGEQSMYELKKYESEIKKQELEIQQLKQNDIIEFREKIVFDEIENLKKQLDFYRKKETEIVDNEEKRFVKSPGDNLNIITKEIDEIEGSIISKGSLICSLADINNLNMVVSVRENDLGKIKPAQKARIFLDAIPYEKFTTLEGEVIRIFPQSKEKQLNGEETYDKVELRIKGFSSNIKKEKLKEVNLKSGLKGRAEIIIKKEKMLAVYFFDKMFE